MQCDDLSHSFCPDTIYILDGKESQNNLSGGSMILLLLSSRETQLFDRVGATGLWIRRVN